MTRAAPALFGLLALVILGGCSVIGEERMHYMKKDWDRIKGPIWGEAGERIGFDEVLPTAKQKEATNEKQICLHGNGRNRVTTQSGVNDKVDYRNCVLAPYQTDAGSRMGNRPDGVGSVVN